MLCVAALCLALSIVLQDPRPGVEAANAHFAAGRYVGLRPFPTGDARQFDFWLGEWDAATWVRDGGGAWVPSGTLHMLVESVATRTAPRAP